MSVESPKRDALATLRIPRRDEPRGPSAAVRCGRRLLVLAVLIGLGYGGYTLAQQQGWLGDVAELVPEAIRTLPEVRVSRVTIERGRAGDAVVVATGYLESRRQAKIGARAAGRIEVVNVEEGSRVRGGEILAVLEHKDMDAALAAAVATRQRAEAELGEHEIEISRLERAFRRAEKLIKTNHISEEEFDQAKFQYEGAVARRATMKAAVALADARVRESEQFNENMIVRAPFDGTVISKDAEVGESILPGGMGEASGRGSVVTIADLEHLEVDCDVKEDYISRVLAGGPAEVAVDAVPDRRYPGRVRKIIPMGDRARATIKVKVEILEADERLFPDMSSTVYFLPEGGDETEDQPEERIFCATEAVQQTEEGASFVWTLDDDDRALRVDVEIGDKRIEQTEILSGLKGGERAILNPPEDIADRMLLRESE